MASEYVPAGPTRFAPWAEAQILEPCEDPKVANLGCLSALRSAGACALTGDTRAYGYVYEFGIYYPYIVEAFVSCLLELTCRKAICVPHNLPCLIPNGIALCALTVAAGEG